MAELVLTRAPHDRRLYVLEGVGTLRLEGLASRTASAEAGGRSWRIERRGFWRRDIQATGEGGAPAGEFEPRRLRRGGTVRWAGRELELRQASRWRERYVLAEGAHVLAVLDGRGFGRRPVRIALEDPAAVEPGLLLFSAFVVRAIAQDARAAAGAGASAG